MPKITTIPATRSPLTGRDLAATRKLKVAAYARVSTGSEEQATSYAAQVDYYTRHIASNPAWEPAGIFTDEGISGTSTTRREGFTTMIQAALDGHIDLILTKSISRFARNTVDTLTTVRKLKDAGVEVWFEKENIHTLDAKGELFITIMSSLAQEESRSISENVKWGHRKRFADGKVFMPYKRFLGYDKTPDGTIVINEDQAQIVRRIYTLFLTGHTLNEIARTLTAQGVPTPGGKTVWSTGPIRSILSNEKYKGDALLQKTFTVDYLTKRKKTNEGEIPQYYVTGSHPAIIDPDTWALAQAELARTGTKRSTSIFSGRITCTQCGATFGSKTWHSTDPYKKVVWTCNRYYDQPHAKPRTNLTEDDLKDAFTTALAKRQSHADTLNQFGQLLDQTAFDTSSLETGLDQARQEVTVVTGMIDQIIAENTRRAQDQNEYRARFTDLEERLNALTEQATSLEEEIRGKQLRAAQARHTLKTLAATKQPEFTTALFHTVCDHMEVHADGTITVVFKDGKRI